MQRTKNKCIDIHYIQFNWRKIYYSFSFSHPVRQSGARDEPQIPEHVLVNLKGIEGAPKTEHLLAASTDFRAEQLRIPAILALPYPARQSRAFYLWLSYPTKHFLEGKIFPDRG
jgi:hypothetical protein